MKRIVTGHDASGKSIFVSNGDPPRRIQPKDLPNLEMVEIWSTEESTSLPADTLDPTTGMASLLPEPGGSRFRIVKFPPISEMEEAAREGKMETIWQEYLVNAPGLAESHESEDPGMHTTDTVDYGIVLSGDIWLELDDEERVHLESGDCVIQNGTRHAWRNLADEPCVMAFVMVGAERA